MMTPAKDVNTSVTTNDNGSSQEYTLLETDQQTTQSNVTPRFKPYTVFNIVKKVAVSHHGDSTFSEVFVTVYLTMYLRSTSEVTTS